MSVAAVGDLSATALPFVPPDLAARGLGLRPETAEDQAFLRTLYISARWEELATTGWPDEAKVEFLSQQFLFQTRHYKSHYARAAWGIITDRGHPSGRLYLHQGPSDLRIIDISLLPSHRSQGIGASLIRAVFAQGVAAGTSVSIHVEVFNHAARRLYDRLGFIQTGGDESIHRRMDWFPPAS